jgi:DNA-binding HxlR family transcriptional regulator
MEYTDIKKFIADKGYRTFNELKEHFSNEDQEILTSQLAFLVSRNSVRRAKFQSPENLSDELYFIPS